MTFNIIYNKFYMGGLLEDRAYAKTTVNRYVIKFIFYGRTKIINNNVIRLLDK